MKPPIIIDAGPLVALINARDTYHAWTVEQLKQASGPLLTCEAALSEAIFLLRTTSGGVSQIGGMLRSGGLK
ncbi:MAG TPA: pilus assembly protein, partial [Kiritimatiellia bacterium]|nr:pilus assembly protein [Kiritimatiellia bacterium]